MAPVSSSSATLPKANPYSGFGKSVADTPCHVGIYEGTCYCGTCRKYERKLQEDLEIAFEYDRNIQQRVREAEALAALTAREEAERAAGPVYPDALPLYTPGDWPVDPPSYVYVTEVLDVPPPPPYTLRYWGEGRKFLPKKEPTPRVKRVHRSLPVLIMDYLLCR